MAEPLVCIDCRYIGKRPSGIGEVVQALVDHLPALAPDLRFLLLKHVEAPHRLSEAPNCIERTVPYAANGAVTMWALPRRVDLSEVALFHATFNILPAGLTMKTVTTIHDIMWLKHPRWASAGLRGRAQALYFRHGLRRALRRSDRLATVSEASRREIEALDPAAAARARVTPLGLARRFRPLPPDEIRLPAQLRGHPYVLTVGQYAPYKNHDVALEAFARAFAERPDMQMVFLQRVGRGRRRLMPLAEALGVAERVHFLPRMDEEGLVALYNGATALLHPSLYEGFGMPQAEAMGCGCPVVASDVSAMPEVTGGAALLAPPHDPAALAAALRRIADEPGLAEQLRRRGLARAAELDWKAFAERNLALYRELL